MRYRLLKIFGGCYSSRKKGRAVKNLSGKIIETGNTPAATDLGDVGRRLRELRDLTGMTQVELAARMGVSRSKVSRLENAGDVSLATLESYVSGLGARLRVDAAFDTSSQVMFRVAEAFDLQQTDEDQLVFPIIDDDNFKRRRDVVLSIRPKYAEPILEGSKTVELRRRFPTKVPSGTLAYIYSTSPTRAMTGIAEIEKVSKVSLEDMWQSYSDVACIAKDDFDRYFEGLDAGFVISLKNARPLLRSIGLTELRDRFEFEAPQSFIYAKPLLREALKYETSAIPH